ncbi:MAG: cysteine desulfurase NifS [Lentisphaeraceae bacterium]|nr:cysteine desulfurase NifS [Lentisphaeraceae bacterium]
MRTVYLDNNATTRPAPEVVEAMRPYFEELWGNPSSMHTFGGQVAKPVAEAREQVAGFINAERAEEILFNGCATEGDNHALFGVAAAWGKPGTIITSRVEHPAVLGPCLRLREMGHTVVEIGVDGEGRFDMEAYEAALAANPGPKLVSVMWANNETGVLFPIKEIAEKGKAAGATVHTDAVQAAGKVPLDVREVPVDLLTIAGHKMHAPKGIGMLYIRRGTRIKPFVIGGHQERGRRGGTENVPYIIGLAKACELSAAAFTDGSHERMARLRDKLEAGLLATCPDSRVNGDRVNRVVNTLNISFEFIEGESVLYHLSDLGICASSGSACAAGSLEPSHVIRAMGVPFTAVHGSIRFSLSRYTTEEEIDYVLAHCPEVVAEMRAISPFVKH